MELKGRLKLIADMVPVCDALCDVGTDHGYIPIYLAEKGICKRAVAVDVNEGPLMAAKTNVVEHKLENIIETRLGDGLQPVSPGEVNVIVVAGMGGELISEILQQGFDRAKAADALILQPMNSSEELRKWLHGNGFDIYDEELIDEGEKLYNVICTRWTAETLDMDETYFYIGKRLIEKKDPLLERYLERRIKTLDRIIDEMENSSKENELPGSRYRWMRERFKEILSGL